MERCSQCQIIALTDAIPNPGSYLMMLEAINAMVEAGEVEITYQTCPIPDVLKDGKFFAPRLFHQFRCTKCGTIYGLLCDTQGGDGQLKINPKVFNPEEYNFFS